MKDLADTDTPDPETRGQRPRRAVILSLLPILLVIAGLEYTHLYGGVFPTPFLALFAGIVVAAMAGGRLGGILAGLLAAGVIIHGYLIGFGPATLTGSLYTVALGILICGLTGYWLGALRDERDATQSELARHRDMLQSDLHQSTLEKDRSISEAARHEARMKAALRMADLGHFEFETRTGDCFYCSPRHAAHVGLTPEEFVEQTRGWEPTLDFVHPDDRERVLALIQRARAGEDIELEYRAVTKDGRIRHIRELVEPVTDHTGQVVGEIGTSMDLTELRLAEKQLMESQKLEAVGRLTAGVAHDFNNLLAVIMGNLELLREVDSESERAEMIDAAIGATERGAALTSKLLSFGRKSMLSPELVDLCDATKELGTLFRRTLPANIDVKLSCRAGECLSFLDRAQFEAAMLNLAVNAADAMPEGGTLRIDGDHQSLDEAAIRGEGLSLEPGDYVRMRVSDTGTGMTEEVRRRALEPFFSTKGVGKGAGLGLPMVLGFARQSGGDVELVSRPGAGTVVNLYFRAAEKPAAQGEASGRENGPEAGRDALVLLVEDDDNVRHVTARQIASLGYRVLNAEDGDAALDIIDARPDISLLLSDVVMPGTLQGPDLVREARARRPDLKCVLMSGYHNVPDIANTDAPLHVPCLTKPIRRAELGTCLAKALREPRRRSNR